MRTAFIFLVSLLAGFAHAQLPQPIEGGFALPNGWRLTPVGRHATLPDYVLNITPSPDGKSIVALHCGHGPHGLAVIDAPTMEVRQQVPL
jgi:hypothetical protein